MNIFKLFDNLFKNMLFFVKDVFYKFIVRAYVREILAAGAG